MTKRSYYYFYKIMAAEEINERSRWSWQRLRLSGQDEAQALAQGEATEALENLPDLEPVSHSRDAEMILAVFRTVVLGAAMIGPFLLYPGYSLGWREIALAGVAGIYNIAVGISCVRPKDFGLRRPFIVAMDMILVTTWMQLGDIFQNGQLFSFYYIVVIMGALWFRVLGGAITAALCNFFFLFFYINSYNDRDLALSSNAVGGIALDTGLLFLVGCLVGYMSEAQEVERQRRLEDQLLIANYQREIDLSTQLQPLLFSIEDETLPANGRRLDAHIEVGVAMQAARTLGGGDYFDILSLPGGKTALFIADVSGKSVRAQARLPLLKYALRALAPLYPEPATLMARLNENLAPDLQRELFIALCCVVLDPKHQTLSWCNAGHNAPLLLPQGTPEMPDGAAETANETAGEPPIIALETDGPALGMFPDTHYQSRTLPWLPGDQLLMYTDGLTDAFSFGGTEDGEAQVRRLCGRLVGRKAGVREETQNFVDMAIAAFNAATPIAERLAFATNKKLAPSTTPVTSNRDDVTVALIRHRDIRHRD